MEQESTTTTETSADFAAGFEDEQPENTTPAKTDARSGEQPQPESESKTSQTDATPDANATPAEPDELAGMPPKVRAMLQEIEALRKAAAIVPQLEQRVRQAEGRLGDLNGRIPKPPPPEPPKLEKFERMRGELPEVAEGIEEFLAHHMPKKAEPTEAPATPQDVMTPVLDDEYPEWPHVITGNEFQSWLATQPEPYRAKVHGTDSEAVIVAALSKFSNAKAAAANRSAAAAQVTQVRQARATSAAVPQGAARRAPTAPDTTSAFASGFDEG